MAGDVLKGTTAMICCALIWGVSPIFFKALSHVPALDVLAHRMIWSLVLFGLLLSAQRRLGLVWQTMNSLRKFGIMMLAALLVAVNWALFIYTIQIGQTTQSSLGYYIYPLVAVLIGRISFSEKLSSLQWGAVVLAGVAVLVLTLAQGRLPWLALSLALSFGFYGTLKKRIPAGPVVSVTAEVVLLIPLAAALLLHSWHNGGAVFGGDTATAFLLLAAGPVTAVPLFLFAYAARRLAMASVGLLFYLNPTLQFCVAVLLFAEPFGVSQLVAFTLIWLALGVWSLSAFRQEKARRNASRAEVASGTTV